MIMSMLLGWTLKISFATNYQPAWPIYFLSIRYCDIIFKPNRQIFCSRLRKVHQFCLKLNRYITRQWRGEIQIPNENICQMRARTRLKIIILDCQIITRSSFASLSDMGLKTFYAYSTPGSDRNNIQASISLLQDVPKKSSLADRLFGAVG